MPETERGVRWYTRTYRSASHYRPEQARDGEGDSGVGWVMARDEEADRVGYQKP